MNVGMLVEMAGEGGDDRIAVGRLTYAGLLDSARRAAAYFRDQPIENVAFVGVNSEAGPVALFGAAIAQKPFAPMNYRWSDDQLHKALAKLHPAIVIVDEDMASRIPSSGGLTVVTTAAFSAALADTVPVEAPSEDTDHPAVLLFTSGTSGDPKVAVLRHDNLVSYILGTVEFMGAEVDEAALASVPPYHIAGIAGVLSAVFHGRRIVQLPTFDPADWVTTAAAENVTHAMVVPTMLVRILDSHPDLDLPSLRHLSYGGGRMPLPVIEAAVTRLPKVDFVNAYGLTETSSTIAVLGPDDHRDALHSDDPNVRRRLSSVGRPLPGVEVEIRADGVVQPAGEPGEVYVRGEQVSGEYLGLGSACDAEGWFPTKDGGWIDEDGFLFVDGRLDDVIVRGGENISPGEIEDVLVAHPTVADAAAVGIPDTDWGEAVAVVVVPAPGATIDPDELRDWVRAHLRSSRVPSVVEVRHALPYNDNGKLVRRHLRADLKRT